MHRFHKYHFPKLSELFTIKALKLLCFSLPARMKLLAMKSTPPVLSSLPLKENPSLSWVVKGTHDVFSLSSWTIQFKKAINRVLDSIIAIIASVLETNYCLWGFYSLEAVWESRGTETLGSVRYSYYRYYEDIQKPSVNSFCYFLWNWIVWSFFSDLNIMRMAFS